MEPIVQWEKIPMGSEGVYVTESYTFFFLTNNLSRLVCARTVEVGMPVMDFP